MVANPPAKKSEPLEIDENFRIFTVSLKWELLLWNKSIKSQQIDKANWECLKANGHLRGSGVQGTLLPLLVRSHGLQTQCNSLKNVLFAGPLCAWHGRQWKPFPYLLQERTAASALLVKPLIEKPQIDLFPFLLTDGFGRYTAVLFRAELDTLDYVWWEVGRQKIDFVKSTFCIQNYYIILVLATDSGRWANHPFLNKLPDGWAGIVGNPEECTKSPSLQVGVILSNCTGFPQRWTGRSPFILTPSGTACLWQSIRKKALLWVPSPSFCFPSFPFPSLLSWVHFPRKHSEIQSPGQELWEPELWRDVRSRTGQKEKLISVAIKASSPLGTAKLDSPSESPQWVLLVPLWLAGL